MDYSAYLENKDKVEKYTELQNRVYSIIKCKSTFDICKAKYFENSEAGYMFENKIAIDKFNVCIQECLSIELEALQKEMEEL